MKNLTLALLISLVLSVFTGAQTMSDEEILRQANRGLSESFYARDFDKALLYARQVLELNLKIYGADNRETAIAYSNLGKLYYLKEKHRDAFENYEKALEIYKKDSAKNAAVIASLMQSVGDVLMSDLTNLDRERAEKAERMYSESLAILENKSGADAREALPLLKSSTEFYAYRSREDEKLVDKTQALFIRYYLTTAKYDPADTDALQTIEDGFLCFLSSSVRSQKQAAERHKQFAEAVAATRRTDNASIVKGEVLNGKAIKFEIPEYPKAARAVRASGRVMVRVLIDEQGSVISAKSFCGHPLLRAASAQAASKAKFSPTLLDGKPYKVVGIIVYNFKP